MAEKNNRAKARADPLFALKILISELAVGLDGLEMTVSPKEAQMCDDYPHGQRDGLRLALAILAKEEAKWSALLGESASWRTNTTRQVRHKTLQVAQKRVQTALNLLTPKDGAEMNLELASAIDKIGL